MNSENILNEMEIGTVFKSKYDPRTNIHGYRIYCGNYRYLKVTSVSIINPMSRLFNMIKILPYQKYPMKEEYVIGNITGMETLSKMLYSSDEELNKLADKLIFNKLNQIVNEYTLRHSQNW